MTSRENSRDHLRNEDLGGVAAKRSVDALLASPLNVDLNSTSPFVVTSSIQLSLKLISMNNFPWLLLLALLVVLQ